MRWRQMLLPLSVHTVKRSARVDGSPESLTVGCLVRNGEMHIEDFLKHHFQLGANHIVLLDNNSTDSTIFLTQKFPDITVLKTKLPFKSHKLLLKKYLYDRYGKKGWFLIVDIDERFDFPGSDQITLRNFLRYLNQNGFTAVMAQMLELFPQSSIEYWPTAISLLRQDCIWYDHSQLTASEYPAFLNNQLANPTMHLYKGGIRKKIFGVDALLTKHPLLYRQGGAKLSLASSHWCHHSTIADVSCVLYHYKFDGQFYQKSTWAAQSENYYQASAEYKAYLHVLEAKPNLRLIQSTSRRFTSLIPLIQDDFLSASAQYDRFIHSCRPISPLVAHTPFNSRRL
jgi:hypothetical protein